MNTIAYHPEVVSFLDDVCQHIRARKLHQEIREELLEHIVEHTADLIEEGKTEQEAITSAIASMGESSQIGRQLDYTHRPRIDWLTLVYSALLLGIGLLAMYGLELHYEKSNFSGNLLLPKAIYIVIGTILLLIFWRLDYQRIKRYSEYIFGAGLVLLAIVFWNGVTINGQTAWLTIAGVTVYVPMLSLFLMTIGLAGVKPIKNYHWMSTILMILYRGVLPILLLAAIQINVIAVLYTIIYAMYLWQTKRNIWQLAPFIGGIIAIAALMLNKYEYLYVRIFGFLNKYDDPRGEDYMITHAFESFKAAGWWGHREIPPLLPYSYSDGILPYIIYYYGWALGIVLLFLIMGFIFRIINAMSVIKDEYGKRLFTLIGTLIIIKFMWSVAMIFGFAPMVGLTLPFVSYSGSEDILMLAVIGFLLGIYRQRMMVSLQVNKGRT